jgi:small GTP-binding protein
MDVVHDDRRPGIILVGASTVGKTMLITRFLGKEFLPEANPTVAALFLEGSVKIGDRDVPIKIWDTAGTERYQAISHMYYHRAAGALLVYDVTSRDSFAKLEEFYNTLREQAAAGIPIVLVGNKTDLGEARLITTEEGQIFAEQHEIAAFWETSAKDGTNVRDAFVDLVAKVIEVRTIRPIATRQQREN